MMREEPEAEGWGQKALRNMEDSQLEHRTCGMGMGLRGLQRGGEVTFCLRMVTLVSGRGWITWRTGIGVGGSLGDFCADEVRAMVATVTKRNAVGFHLVSESPGCGEG